MLQRINESYLWIGSDVLDAVSMYLTLRLSRALRAALAASRKELAESRNNLQESHRVPDLEGVQKEFVKWL